MTPITSLPFTIYTPGAYRLEVNGVLSGGTAADYGLIIGCDDVEIDGQGHSISNGYGYDNEATGVFGAERSNIRIRNMLLKGFKHGIRHNTSGYAKGGWLVENVEFNGITQRAVWLYGAGNTVRNIRARRTGGSTAYASSRAIAIDMYGPGSVVNGVQIYDTFSATEEAVDIALSDCDSGEVNYVFAHSPALAGNSFALWVTGASNPHINGVRAIHKNVLLAMVPETGGAYGNCKAIRCGPSPYAVNGSAVNLGGNV